VNAGKETAIQLLSGAGAF